MSNFKSFPNARWAEYRLGNEIKKLEMILTLLIQASSMNG